MPAAAVIRRVQALIGITGRKAHAGGTASDTGKLESRRGGRIPKAVKCVEIWRNTGGEGGPRTKTDAQVRKRGEQTGLDTPGSPRRKRCRLGGCAP